MEKTRINVMKYLLCIIICCLVSNHQVHAADISYSTGQNIIHLIDLPDNEDFIIDSNSGVCQYLDLGILHEQFSLCGIPIWNYGEKTYVLYIDDTYYELDDEQLDYIKKNYINIPEEPELPFWDVYGGKLLLLLLMLFLICYIMIKNHLKE